MKKKVIVIGGGVAGMQTALRLAEQGVEPTIIEKEPELAASSGGGTCCSRRSRPRRRC